MFYTAHRAYSGSGSSCRNLERVVLVSELTVYLYSTASSIAIGQLYVTHVTGLLAVNMMNDPLER